MKITIDADATITREGGDEPKRRHCGCIEGTEGCRSCNIRLTVDDRPVPQLAVAERSCGCGPRQDCTMCNPRWFGWQPVSMKCSECGEYTRVVPGRWETCGCWRTVHYVS